MLGRLTLNHSNSFDATELIALFYVVEQSTQLSSFCIHRHLLTFVPLTQHKGEVSSEGSFESPQRTFPLHRQALINQHFLGDRTGENHTRVGLVSSGPRVLHQGSFVDGNLLVLSWIISSSVRLLWLSFHHVLSGFVYIVYQYLITCYSLYPFVCLLFTSTVLLHTVDVHSIHLTLL